MSLDAYYAQIQGQASNCGETITTFGSTSLNSNGYSCPGCGMWVYPYCYHTCKNCRPDVWSFYYPCPEKENPMEKAFKLIKVLIQKELIAEPKSFKEFCDLLDAVIEALK